MRQIKLKKQPLWKRLLEFWPLVAIFLTGIGWIVTQAVHVAQADAEIAEHDKRLDENEVKDKEQDSQITQQMVQFQLISQSLTQISDQLKDIKQQKGR